MNNPWKALIYRVSALACAAALCCYAPAVRADDTVNDLERQTSELQNELDALNGQLESLSAEITELTSRIDEADASVQIASLDLAAAKVNEEMQYEAMKRRIKYIYESGSISLLEIIFSSENMAEFLNNAQFVQNITEYDRAKLQDLTDARQAVAEKEEALKAQQAELASMQERLQIRQDSLNQAIASTSGRLSSSSEALAAAEAALKKKQEEETAKQQASAPSEGQAQNAPSGGQIQNAPSGGQTPGTPSESRPSGGSQSPGSSGTVNVPSTPAETNDLVLFAAILQCEAGSTNYDGLLAVATVIMNRMESPRYPNTLSGVIYQNGQFSPTWNGSLNRVLANGPAPLCYQAAQDALNGARLAAVSGCYSFRAAYTGRPGTVIGGNVFF